MIFSYIKSNDKNCLNFHGFLFTPKNIKEELFLMNKRKNI